MNVFKAVREKGITARQAAEYCGIKINRNGMAVCPFHKDKNPSMKIIPPQSRKILEIQDKM